jgi:hypothetical protein
MALLVVLVAGTVVAGLLAGATVEPVVAVVRAVEMVAKEEIHLRQVKEPPLVL